jgi:hypothetical protein
VALSLIAAALVCGCGATQEVTPPRAEEREATDLRTAERDFRPSDYGREAAGKSLWDSSGTGGGTGGTDSVEAGVTPDELVQGFRVQVFSTSDIDIAKARMSDAELAFPAEWFYLSYDPPVYKIRAGNFLNRLDAERFMASAQERGFRGAWVVPEKVITNPPPPPPREVPPAPK